MEATLTERGSRYGSWREQARIAQNIKEALRDSPNWNKLPAYMREMFDINANKAARMLNGDFMYLDNLHDMTNYCKLAEDCLEQDLAGGAGPYEVIDPAHFDPDLVAKLLETKGWTVTPPPVEDRTEEVVGPAFLKDPVREAGMRFTSAPPLRGPRDGLVDMVREWIERGEPVHLYASPDRKLCGDEVHVYASNSGLLYDDLRNREVDAYSVKQDLLGIERPPVYIGCIQFEQQGKGPVRVIQS